MQSDPNARYALGELTCWRRFGIDPGADFRSDPSVPRIGLSISVVSRSDAGQSKIGTSIANGSMVDRRQQDKPVVGAVGGSALKYFRVILDYPSGSACFWSTASR